MRKLHLFTISAALFLIIVSMAVADIPRLITYQGRLTDDAGVPVPDGIYDVNFAIHDDSTSGSLLWGEIQAVTTTNGLFNVQLGFHTSLDETIFIDYADVFISLQLSGEPEMSPRTRLTSNAFCYEALHAEAADYALAAVVGGGWRDDGTIIRLDSSTDSVGIGTSTPTAKLDVVGDATIRGKTTFGTNQTNTGDGASISGGVDNIAEGIVSTIGGGQANLSSGDGSTISGGGGNHATNSGATVGGGFFNYARGRSAVVAGGGEIGAPTDSNSALGDYSVISGGRRNVAAGYHSVIGGGDFNSANGQGAIIGGGGGNIADAVAATIAGGGSNRIYVPADNATIGGGGYNRAHGAFSVVAGGGGSFTSDSNAALGSYSAILGGRANTAVGEGTVIGGGESNTTGGNNTVIGGGELNQALATNATISGGDHNVADGIRSTVSGGGINHAEGSGSAIVGGSFNHASGEHAFVGGGQGNFARGSYSFVGGGGGATNAADTNSAQGFWSVIAGGRGNLTSDSGAVIGGGCSNRARGLYSVVAGGGNRDLADSNSAIGNWSFIGGGAINVALGHAAVISGGVLNRAEGVESTVAGGSHNTAGGDGSTVGGGLRNKAWGDYSVINGGGGFYASDSNSAMGECATIPGGQANVADGDFSFAAGFRAKALHEGTFVWADHSHPYSDFQSTGANKFLIRASGGVGIGTVSPGAMLDVADDDRALRLRAGNGQAEYVDHQILLSFDGSVNYSHVIKSRHSGSTDARNAIDFFVWDQSVDAVTEAGTKHVMTIDGDNDGEVGIGTTEPNYTLDVRGTIGNNTTTYHSDERWKTDIETISGALEKVTALRGVNFKWRQDEYEEMNFPAGEHLGVIAQEVEEVLPQLVHTAADGYKSVEYANLTALLIEAVKELRLENQVLKQRLENLEEKVLSK